MKQLWYVENHVVMNRVVLSCEEAHWVVLWMALGRMKHNRDMYADHCMYISKPFLSLPSATDWVVSKRVAADFDSDSETYVLGLQST
jgi:hypothetical protein